MAALILALVLGADIYVQAGAVGGDGGSAAPFATVQRGVNAAASGDVVHLRPGTYTENVSITRNGVTLVSDADGGVGATIDGRNLGPTLEVNGVGWKIDGVRFLNGNLFDLVVLGDGTGTCTAGPVPGGLELARVTTGGIANPATGVCATSADPGSYGVSIQCLAGKIFIHDSRFIGDACTASLGLGKVAGSPLTIQDNELTGAHWQLMLLEAVQGGEVTRNWLHGPCCDGNIGGAVENSSGLFVYAGSANLSVHHNLFVATGDVGVVAWDEFNANANENFVVRNNTVIDPKYLGISLNAVSGTVRSNLVSGVQVSGISQYCDWQSGVGIVNSEGLASGPSAATVGYDLIEGLASPYCTAPSNATITYSGPVSTAAPRFVDRDGGDYRLLGGSPAIDTGDPASDAGFDFDQTPFPQDGLGLGTPRADIGAFEYRPPGDGGSGDGGSGDAGALDGGSGDAGNIGGPVAIIEPALQTVAPGDTVTLDAQRSQPSPGASLVRFRWSEPQGPTGVALGEGATATFTTRQPGDYAFRLVVNDSTGASSAPATAQLHVSGDSAHAPQTLSVGCGCQAGSSAGFAVLGVGVFALRWRRRRRV